MKAISLWQPWASLVITGAKEYETRHWQTNYRGLLAIHAAKRWTPAEKWTAEWFKHDHSVTTFNCLGYWPDVPLPLGAMLGIVKLVDILPTEQCEDFSRAELAFGNYAPGRFAWKLEVVEMFAEPILTKGHQGFWDWERPAS